MLIRSQDKKSIINLDNIESVDICGYRVEGLRNIYRDEENANTWYVAYSGYEKTLFIGHYSTEAKAIKVLDMIQDFYNAVELFRNLSGEEHRRMAGNIPLHEYADIVRSVFQMPSDEEAEG